MAGLEAWVVIHCIPDNGEVNAYRTCGVRVILMNCSADLDWTVAVTNSFFYDLFLGPAPMLVQGKGCKSVETIHNHYPCQWEICLEDRWMPCQLGRARYVFWEVNISKEQSYWVRPKVHQAQYPVFRQWPMPGAPEGMIRTGYERDKLGEVISEMKLYNMKKEAKLNSDIYFPGNCKKQNFIPK